jgi:hypothetical protein
MGCNGRDGIWGSQDLEYLRKVDADRLGASGTTAEYYSLNRGINVDPLYSEPNNDPLYGGDNSAIVRGTPQTASTSWDFVPDISRGEEPLIVACAVEYVEFENRTPSVRPDGKMVEYDAVMSMSSLTWECKIQELDIAALIGRVPKEGDVVYVFEEWWDVIKAGKSGNIRGTSVTVGYRMDLKKRSQFTPDRKI